MKKIMNNNEYCKLIPLLVTLALFFTTSCSRPDTEKYYQPPLNPDGTEIINPGEVIVSLPTIPGMPETLPEGTVTTVTVTDTKSKTYTIVPGKPIDLEAGEYAATVSMVVPDNGAQGSGVSSLPQGVLIGRESITLPIAEDGQVPNLPHIFTGAGMLNIIPNTTTNVDVQCYPMTRAIVVEIALNGIATEKVKDIHTSLYGVAAQRSATKSLARQSLPTPYYATAQAAKKDGNWNVILRLLGISSEVRQVLRIVCQFNDNTAPYTYEVDVTNLLKAFNQGSALQPSQLKATIDFSNASVGGSISGSISGWTPGADEDIDVVTE